MNDGYPVFHLRRIAKIGGRASIGFVSAARKGFREGLTLCLRRMGRPEPYEKDLANAFRSDANVTDALTREAALVYGQLAILGEILEPDRESRLLPPNAGLNGRERMSNDVIDAYLRRCLREDGEAMMRLQREYLEREGTVLKDPLWHNDAPSCWMTQTTDEALVEKFAFVMGQARAKDIFKPRQYGLNQFYVASKFIGDGPSPKGKFLVVDQSKPVAVRGAFFLTMETTTHYVVGRNSMPVQWRGCITVPLHDAMPIVYSLPASDLRPADPFKLVVRRKRGTKINDEKIEVADDQRKLEGAWVAPVEETSLPTGFDPDEYARWLFDAAHDGITEWQVKDLVREERSEGMVRKYLCNVDDSLISYVERVAHGQSEQMRAFLTALLPRPVSGVLDLREVPSAQRRLDAAREVDGALFESMGAVGWLAVGLKHWPLYAATPIVDSVSVEEFLRIHLPSAWIGHRGAKAVQDLFASNPHPGSEMDARQVATLFRLLAYAWVATSYLVFPVAMTGRWYRDKMKKVDGVGEDGEGAPEKAPPGPKGIQMLSARRLRDALGLTGHTYFAEANAIFGEASLEYFMDLMRADDDEDGRDGEVSP